MQEETVTMLKPSVTLFEAISEIFGRKTNCPARKRLECSLVWTHFFDKRNIKENSELLPVCNRVPRLLLCFLFLLLLFLFFYLLCSK